MLFIFVLVIQNQSPFGKLFAIMQILNFVHCGYNWIWLTPMSKATPCS
jgi:hypothetical protein